MMGGLVFGNIVPQNRFNPFFGVMKSVTHTPTSAANPFQAPNLDLYYSNPNNTDTLTTKIDHRFSASDSLSGRFTRGRATNRLEGGRFGYTDQGETPNTQVTLMDFGATKLIFEVRGLRTEGYRGQTVGNIFHLEEGVIAGRQFFPRNSTKPAPLPRVETPNRGGEDGLIGVAIGQVEDDKPGFLGEEPERPCCPALLLGHVQGAGRPARFQRCL